MEVVKVSKTAKWRKRGANCITQTSACIIFFSSIVFFMFALYGLFCILGVLFSKFPLDYERTCIRYANDGHEAISSPDGYVLNVYVYQDRYNCKKRVMFINSEDEYNKILVKGTFNMTCYSKEEAIYGYEGDCKDIGDVRSIGDSDEVYYTTDGPAYIERYEVQQQLILAIKIIVASIIVIACSLAILSWVEPYSS